MIAADFARWVFNLLGLLREADDAFSRFSLVDRNINGYKPVDGLSEEEFERLLISNLSSDVTYINPGGASRLATRESRCVLGFSAAFETEEKPSGFSSFFRVAIGQSNPKAIMPESIVFNFSGEKPRSFYAKLLSALVRYSDPHHAVCDSWALSQRKKQPVGDVRIGWLTYLSDPRAAGFLQDIAVVSPLGKGILVQISDLQEFSLEESVIAKIRVIVDRLGEAGLLANPLRHNLPQRS